MGLKLRLAAVWTPWWVQRRELDRILGATTRALNVLLFINQPGVQEEVVDNDPQLRGGLAKRREIMSYMQSIRVVTLAVSMGREAAVELGRATMYEVGLLLGERARARLGVGDSMDDLVRAARVMYRVLGIDFRVERPSPDRAVLRVSRCALSKWYTNDACLVMSAADEGVVRGLNPAVGMTFSRRIAYGAPECEAEIVVGPLANGPVDAAPAAKEVGS